MPSFETLTWEEDDHVRLVGLNRADKRNAFDVAMIRELAEAYTAFEEDGDAWCLLLHAHGDHFTGGLDLAKVGPAVRKEGRLFPEDQVDPLDLFGRRRSKPVVCAVQGWCLTIGIELLLASDIRIAANTTRFGQMEVQRGIMPFGGATLRFPQVCGWGDAMRWLLTGEKFDAAEALRIRLVQEVVPAAELLERGRELARLVAKQAPLAVQATRRNSRVAVEQGTDAALEELMGAARGLMDTKDAMEGMMSFVERREAKFRGE